MATILDYYKYSYLAAAAYVDLGNAPLKKAQISTVDFINAAKGQNRLPAPLANYLFTPNFNDYGPAQTWAIDYYQSNDSTGFAATLFEQGSQKVLALRGTELANNLFDSVDLFQADFAEIGLLGMAFTQTVSMVNLILRMKALETDLQVTQLHVQNSLSPMPGRVLACPWGADIACQPQPATGRPLASRGQARAANTKREDLHPCRSVSHLS